MPLMPLSKLLVCLLFTFGASTAVGGDGTCKLGGNCENDTPKHEDISALFQGKNAQVLTARVSSTNGSNMVWQASMRPRLQKIMELGATIQDIKESIGVGNTPEVPAIIESLIKIIEDDLQEKIKRDQTSAQTELDTRMDALTTQTESAFGLKVTADVFDKSLDQCVTEEHQMLEAYETCKDEEAALTGEKASTAFCSNPDFDIWYASSLQLPATLDVDFNKGLDFVKEELDLYLQPLHEHISNIKRQAVIDQAKWDVAEQKCEAKKVELQEKTEECGQKLGAWQAQHDKCYHAKDLQKLKLCGFGHAYQVKCAAKTAVDTLKADIVGFGTTWSEPDRKNEWRQTTRLACVLDEFKSTTDLTVGAVDKCTKSRGKAADEFENDVGTIDLKQTTYDSLTSQAKFTCDETDIKFGSGVLWTAPNAPYGWIPKSTDYEKVAGHTYAIESDASQAPFDFCLTQNMLKDAPICGLWGQLKTYRCKTQSNKPADIKCFLSGGCTQGDCCNKIPVCGDHVIDEEEDCDDGNNLADDACPATCRQNWSSK